jgi:hypothetical protein
MKVRLNEAGAKWYLENLELFGNDDQLGEDYDACIYMCLCTLMGAPLDLQVTEQLYDGYRVIYNTPFGRGWNNIAFNQVVGHEYKDSSNWGMA